MKKLLFLIIVLFAINNANATGIPLEYGARLVMNMAKFSDDWPNWDADQKFRLGFLTGLYAGILINTQLSIMSELLYFQKGSVFESSNNFGTSKYTYLLQYMAVNIFVRYMFIRNFFVFLGPQFGFLLSGEEKWENDGQGFSDSGSYDLKDELRAFELGLVLGVAYQFSFGLILDFRFNRGLTNIWDASNKPDFKNTLFMFGVAYSISRLFSRR